jgi:hypothetical protein
MTKADRRVGLDRVRMMDDAVARLSARAVPPPLVSPNIVAAPARGQVDILRLNEVVMTPSGPRVRPSSVDGYHPVRAETALDGMVREARKVDPDGRQAFSPMHRDTARAYAALSERVASAGIRCSSVEALSQGGSGGGSWIDAVMADSARLARLHVAIGDGLVMIPRNAQAQADRGRSAIAVRRLVDMVCLADRSLSAVLHAHGWGRWAGNREKLRAALCSALDRMQRVAS